MPPSSTHNDQLETLITSLLDGLEAASSARIYRHDIDTLLRFCAERGVAVLQAERTDLLAYAASLRDRGLAPDTRRRMQSVARRLFDEAIEQGLRGGANPASRLPRIRAAAAPAASALSVAEADRLLAHLALRRDQLREPLPRARASRDHFLVLTGLLLALRAAELARLVRGDLARAGDYDVLQVRGKGGSQTAIKVNRQWLDALDAFEQILSTASLRLGPGDALYPRLRGRRPLAPLGTRSISRIADQALAAIGRRERRSAAHLLRKTSITLVYEASHDVLLAQRQGRHRRVDTTVSHYIDPADRLAETGIDYLKLASVRAPKP